MSTNLESRFLSFSISLLSMRVTDVCYVEVREQTQGLVHTYLSCNRLSLSLSLFTAANARLGNSQL